MKCARPVFLEGGVKQLLQIHQPGLVGLPVVVHLVVDEIGQIGSACRGKFAVPGAAMLGSYLLIRAAIQVLFQIAEVAPPDLGVDHAIGLDALGLLPCLLLALQ
ncbi:hypothetical protein D3C72_2109940 [compost metagenome]